MEQEILQNRNAVFNRIYINSLTLYKACIPVSCRWLMEIYLLILALVTLFVWGYVHFTYIVNSEDCLTNLITERPFPQDIILQVEAYSNSSEIWHEREKALQNMYNAINSKNSKSNNVIQAKSYSNTSWINNYCETSFFVNLTGTRYFCELILTALLTSDGDGVSDRVGSRYRGGGHDKGELTCVRTSFLDIINESHMCVVPLKSEMDEREFFSKNYTLIDTFGRHIHMQIWDYALLEFSQEPGYLSLTDSARLRLNISVVKIYLDPSSTTCFGGPFGQLLTKYFLGYDMMIISSFRGLLPSTHASGYVKDLLSGSQYYYKVQWMGKWRYGAGFLPALFFTLVASVLLRRIHYHIFKFLTHFHHLLNQGIPMPIQTGAQIPFLVVTYATIGLVIVMSEALSDDSVFSLLMVCTVWEVDQFYSLYCKQITSKLYLPWFFFLYHFLPYAYYIRFNGQFWFIPFLFHWFLLQHAMLFFLHHCELPSWNHHLRNHAPLNLQPPAQPPAQPPPLGIHLPQEPDVAGVDFPDEEENSDTASEDQNRSSLLRHQLHRTTSDASSSSVSSRTVEAPQEGDKSQQQLTDEELRKVRLQRFEIQRN